MINKDYYQEKLQDKITQRNKAINRLISDIYVFVKENEDILSEANKINELIKAEEAKKPEPDIAPKDTKNENN